MASVELSYPPVCIPAEARGVILDALFRMANEVSVPSICGDVGLYGAEDI